jgi:uncharacterized membrane protein YphA (DoxX/SURF4 family)
MAHIANRYFASCEQSGWMPTTQGIDKRTRCWRANLLESGRNLAKRIPYSFLVLASGFAVADTSFGDRARPIPLLPPDLAAYLSTIGEHVLPVLLVIGFATRLSASSE